VCQRSLQRLDQAALGGGSSAVRVLLGEALGVFGAVQPMLEVAFGERCLVRATRCVTAR
jgi:hypothetical protein